MSHKEENKVSISSNEDTDSADESFVFTKRKQSSFFIDLTDGESDSKRVKLDPKPVARAEVSEDSEVQFVKFIPGESSSSQESAVSEVHEVQIEDSGKSKSTAAVVFNTPKLFSPPRVVRVTSANYVKSHNVIDLTERVPVDQEKQKLHQESAA